MIGNIDGDLIAFRCSASVGLSIKDIANLPIEELQRLQYPDETEEIAILRTDKLMRDLLYNTGCEEYNCYLTGKGNFRYKINDQYKANRKDKEPPRWLQSCRQYLVSEWSAQVTSGCEADDYLGINQQENSICISLDKDLLMIPGWHFNWLNNEKSYVVPLEGLKTFYKQMLIGDVTDNIFGVKGIGKVKAGNIIDNIDTEEEMITLVFNLYEQDVKRFFMNANCLWIMQKEKETWQQRVDPLILPLPLQQELDTTLDSMISLMEDISMELGTTKKMMSGIQDNGELMVVCPPIHETN